MLKDVALLKSVFNLFPIYVKRMLYFAFVYSHICYCIALWGGTANVHTHKVLVIQKRQSS
jgi:hypothetical protein